MEQNKTERASAERSCVDCGRLNCENESGDQSAGSHFT